jgi:hypothetical protein
MKRSLTVVLASLFVPAVAAADEPPVPTTTTTTTTTTEQVQPPPPPTDPTPPIVIVNPQPQPARTVIEPGPVETEEVVDAWNAPVFATGAAIFAASYGASAIVAGSSDHAGADRLFVPIAGPWLALNDWGNCPITNAACDNNTTDKVLLIADGIVQAAGVVTMLDGLFMPTHHTIVTRTAYDTKVHVRPTHTGVSVFGRF